MGLTQPAGARPPGSSAPGPSAQEVAVPRAKATATVSLKPRPDSSAATTVGSDAHAPSERASARSPLLASALSFAFPGAGQLYLGQRRAAAIFAVPTVVVLLWVILQLRHGLVYFALGMLDQGYALTVLFVAAAFTLWRAASIVGPFVVARSRPISVASGVGMCLLLIATLGMGYVVASNAYDAYDASGRIATNDFHVAYASEAPLPTPLPVIAGATSESQPTDESTPLDSPSPEVSAAPDPCATPAPATPGPTLRLPKGFLGDPVPAASSSDSASPSPSESPSPSASATASATASASPSESPSDSPSPSPPAPTESPSPAAPTESPSPSAPAESPTPTPLPPWGRSHNSNRLTIVLAGVDFMSGRHHALTDSLMLVSVDLRSRAVTLVSVPRDTAGFPFYWGGQAPDDFRINDLANAIAGGEFGSPDSPMVTLANEIGYLVGIRVDYYAEIDMDGFFQMVDLVGGVDINNPTTLDDPFSCTYVPAGPVHLDAQLALQYVRSRESTSDYDRAARQQRVLIALERKVATPAVLPMLGSLLDQASQSISTNFPLGSTRDYLDLAENIGSISQFVLGPPYNYHPDSSTTGGSWTSRLLLDRVAELSVALFGSDSRYYGTGP